MRNVSHEHKDTPANQITVIWRFLAFLADSLGERGSITLHSAPCGRATVSCGRRVFSGGAEETQVPLCGERDVM